MGRELRRKQAKKEGKDLHQKPEQQSNELKKYVLIIGILILIFVLIYLISGIFITKEIKWFSHEENKPIENKADEIILASAIFRQSEEEYYVYFYDFNDIDNNIENTITSKLNDKKIYRVDTSSALNSNYVSEKSNKEAKTLEELKVASNTLIKISNNTITEYYESNEILEKL